MKDIFFEDKKTPVKGLIRRYHNRALMELTMRCPVECEFCFRKWKKEQCREDVSVNDIDNIFKYISKHQEITELILSGGDPLMAIDLVKYVFEKLESFDQIKVVRIHTRAVVTAPKLVTNKFINILKKKYKQVVYLSIHINHPDELTPLSEAAIEKIRKTGTILYTQSVFLKGINDSIEVLEKLFTRLVELGVRPYNIYQCNEIEGIKHFIVPLKKEIELMTELRKRISGFACPNLIVDAPGSANKIPVPLNFWKTEITNFSDFEDVVRQTPGL